MKKIILSIPICLSSFGISAQIEVNPTDTLVKEITYIGENIFVKNPFAPSSGGFSSEKVLLNGKEIAAATNQSAFEIKLSEANLQLNEKIKIEIIYLEGRNTEPTILND